MGEKQLIAAAKGLKSTRAKQGSGLKMPAGAAIGENGKITRGLVPPAAGPAPAAGQTPSPAAVSLTMAAATRTFALTCACALARARACEHSCARVDMHDGDTGGRIWKKAA